MPVYIDAIHSHANPVAEAEFSSAAAANQGVTAVVEIVVIVKQGTDRYQEIGRAHV